MLPPTPNLRERLRSLFNGRLARHSSTPANRRPSVAILGTRGYPSYYGGFETAVRRIAPHLTEHGWDVTVYGRPGGIRAEDPARDPRVRSVTTRGIDSKKASTLTFGFTSAVHAFRSRPDVVIVMNCANGLWLPLLKARGIKTAVNVDGMEWERAKWGRLARAFFKAGAHLTARFADVIICDAEAIAARWRTDFKRESTVIAYGGDPVEPSPVPLGLARRGYVLLVARFVPENTVQAFFDAVPDIAPKVPVVLVGSSGFEDEFDARAKKLGELANVFALGHVSDDELLHSLWAHAGAYFHGHSVGGTNPALVQAMASGAPIVARDTIFNREVLRDTALFVQPDPNDIRAGVMRLIGEEPLADELADSALTRAATVYSWDSICAAYERVASDLAGRD